MIDCSVIILNYNTKEWLERCVQSIREQTRAIRYELWVVDNNSQDGSAELIRKKFPDVHLIANSENLFVAKGFNQGIRASSSRYVFIGDADLEFTDNLIGEMVEFMDKNQTIAALGSPFYDPNGELYSKYYSRDHTWLFSLLNYTFLGKIFKSQMKKIRYHFEYGDWDRKSSRYVDIVDTAIMYRRVTLDEVGLYDEHFNFYSIQNDLCLRIRQAGWGIYYLYKGHLIHAQHQSIQKENWSKISSYYRQDVAYYLKKQYGTFASGIVICLLHLTRYMVYIARFLRLYQPKKNTAFGT